MEINLKIEVKVEILKESHVELELQFRTLRSFGD